MPLTPFHFGPAALAHAVAPKHISFLAFCGSNVLIDLEPLYYILTNQPPLHRFFHTYLGACLILVLTIAIFLVARRLAGHAPIPNLFRWKQLTPTSVALGAALGVFSHIALDSIMHADMHPFAPLSDANGLLHVVPHATLHTSCLAAGMLGIFVLGMRRAVRWARGTNDAPGHAQ